MKHFWPRSLTSQTTLLLFVGLAISHFLSMLIYSDERSDMIHAVAERNTAARIARTAQLMMEAPSDMRPQIQSLFEDPDYRIWLTPQEMFVDQETEGSDLSLVRSVLIRNITVSSRKSLKVQIINYVAGAELTPEDFWYKRFQDVLHIFEGVGLNRVLRVSVQMQDGTWINVSADIPEVSEFWSSTSMLSIFAMAAAIFLLSLLVVKRLTAPLRKLALASRRLGRDMNAPYLEEGGPLEVREATESFNEMQQRLKHLIENRTDMLAAISHDLRTPITLMRLRLEAMKDSVDKTRLIDNLDNMDRMIEATLDFARQDNDLEEREKVDITALVESSCNDYADAGHKVTFHAKDRIILECQPIAIKRALTNIIDNALKHGEEALVDLKQVEGHLQIDVRDKGPGIPTEKLDQVFRPFFRCEDSRNQETGGVGLGLSIAQSIVESHGGRINLTNIEGAGLLVQIELPVE